MDLNQKACKYKVLRGSMKKLLIGLLALVSLSAFAKTEHCKVKAEKMAMSFLSSLLISEYGWDEVLYVKKTYEMDSYRVVKNEFFSMQKHENYTFKFETADEKGREYGLGSVFEIQMFANQGTPNDDFICYTNSFKLIKLKEGIKL